MLGPLRQSGQQNAHPQGDSSSSVLSRPGPIITSVTDVYFRPGSLHSSEITARQRFTPGLLVPRYRRDDGFMTARGWGRVGWVMFVAAVAGMTGYLVNVGWGRASAIAGVAGFFVGVAGLALALAARHSAGPRFRQRMRHVHGGAVTMTARIAGDAVVVQDMGQVTARGGSVQQAVESDGRRPAVSKSTDGGGDA